MRAGFFHLLLITLIAGSLVCKAVSRQEGHCACDSRQVSTTETVQPLRQSQREITTETADREHIAVSLNKKLSDQQALCNDYTYYKVDVTEACKDLRIQNPFQGQFKLSSTQNQIRTSLTLQPSYFFTTTACVLAFDDNCAEHPRELYHQIVTWPLSFSQVMDVTEGEPNIYVAKSPNNYPTYNSLAWSSYNWGGEDLVISSWDPEFTVGTYYIGVHAYCGEDVKTKSSDAKYSLLVTSEPTSHPHTEITIGGSQSGRLSAEDYNYYRFCIPSSCANVEVRLENCIDPKDCPTSYAWPELLVSRSIVEPQVNDHTWKLATIKQRSVLLNHDDPDFYPGHYFVGIYGWCTPTDHCPNVSSCGPCTYAQDHQYNVSVLVQDVMKGCVPKQSLELCEGGSTGKKNGESSILLFCGLLISSMASVKFWF